MHLQRAVDGFDVFARSLSIGAETMVMHFEPDRPLHDRYQVDHDFLDAETGREVVTIGRTVNAFFRWEFNSCETLIKDGEVHPIDYANACPDVSLISLHYYFPWAIKALLRWTVYCCATGRRMRVAMDPDAVVRRRRTPTAATTRSSTPTASSPTTTSRSRPTRSSATATSATSTRRWPSTSPRPTSTRCWCETVTRAFPPREHEQFVAHYRGLLGAWVADQA